MNLPLGAIHAALKMKTKHFIYYSGLNEITLRNVTTNPPDDKCVQYTVFSDSNKHAPAPGVTVCHACSNDKKESMFVLSSLDHQSKMHVDERVLLENGNVFVQKLKLYRVDLHE